MSSGMLLGFRYETTLKFLEPALSSTRLDNDVMSKINNNLSHGSVEIPDELLRIGAA
jgi:hypothetical protein